MRCKMKDLGARSEGGRFGGVGALVMNLCRDHKVAKVDCWLTGCRRHFTPSPKYTKTMTASFPMEKGSRTGLYL